MSGESQDKRETRIGLIIMGVLLLVFLIFTGIALYTVVPIAKYLVVGRPDKDVTTASEYNFSSFAGTVWKTKVKTAIADGKRYTGATDLGLLPPRYFETTDPDYDPPRNSKIITILPPGARLRITRLMQDQGNWGGVQVEAVLLDGTNAQKTVFLNGFLLAGNRWFRGPETNTGWDVNPAMLEK